MTEINYDKFMSITNMSKDTFANTSKRRKAKSLERLGYKVLEIKGRGLNSVFVCEETEDLKLKKDLEDVIGINIKYPKVMNKYLSLLLADSMDISFYSDRRVAEVLLKDFKIELSSLIQYVIQCRKELIESGMMKAVIRDKTDRNATERKVVLKSNVDFSEKFIDSNEAIDNWKYLYFEKVKELTNVAKLNSNDGLKRECNKEIRQKAFKYMQDKIGGSMYTVYKKEFDINKFKNN